MTSQTIVKLVGTLAAAVVAGGAAFFPETYRPLALAVAGLLLGWLHLPRPGDTKSAPLVPPLLLLLVLGASLHLVACGAAQDKEQATLAAITAGCKVSLDLDRDAGAAGAVDAEADACRKTLHVWEARP